MSANDNESDANLVTGKDMGRHRGTHADTGRQQRPNAGALL